MKLYENRLVLISVNDWNIIYPGHSVTLVIINSDRYGAMELKYLMP
jgi:hypothetical protein